MCWHDVRLGEMDEDAAAGNAGSGEGRSGNEIGKGQTIVICKMTDCDGKMTPRTKLCPKCGANQQELKMEAVQAKARANRKALSFQSAYNHVQYHSAIAQALCEGTSVVVMFASDNCGVPKVAGLWLRICADVACCSDRAQSDPT